MATNHKEAPQPTFARASQIMFIVAELLDNLLAPSTDGVNKVYQQLKDILGAATAQQAERSLQHHVEASVSTLGYSKAGWPRAA
jgi:hypothetical protein